jgi:hypothetical protein
MTTRFLRVALCALGLILGLGALAGPAAAEGEIQPSGPPLSITADPGGAVFPAVASDAAGNFVVVWLGRLENTPLGSFASILLQRYDVGGHSVGPQIEAASHILPVLGPRIAVGPGGGMVLVWSDELFQVRAQRLAADGQPVGAVITVSAEIPDSNYLPDVAFLRSGDFVVVWHNYHVPFFEPIFFDDPVMARLFAPDGTPRGAAFLVNSITASTTYARVAADPAGGFAVAWENNSFPILQVRRFAADGTPLGPQWSVSADLTGSAGSNRTPLPLFSPAGELSVAWVNSSFSSPFDPPGLFAQRFAADGSFLGPKIRLADGPALDAPPYAVDDRQGHRLLVWGAPGAAADSPREIRARLFDTAWQPAQPTLRVAQFTPRRSVNGGPYIIPPWPVAAASAGGFLVAWDSLPSPTAPAPQVTAQILASPCPENTLCLQNGRFQAAVAWRDPRSGETGTGKTIPLTSDTGAFWFFTSGNAELLVKVLDGRNNNGNWWVFFGALTDVEYDLTVTDTQTGAQKVYHNPPFTMASRADVDAFPDAPSPAPPQPSQPVLRTTLPRTLLGDFEVYVSWIDPITFETRQAIGVPLSGDSAYFWFFDATNIELVVKILDGRLVNGHRWVFFGALTDVEYTITVIDRLSGASKSYHNPHGRMASQADTSAF